MAAVDAKAEEGARSFLVHVNLEIIQPNIEPAINILLRLHNCGYNFELKQLYYHIIKSDLGNSSAP